MESRLSYPIPSYPFLSYRGVIGSGKQGFSWVSLSDVVRAIDFLLTDAKAGKLRGAVNICSPNPSDNAGFTSAMGRLVTDGFFHRISMCSIYSIFTILLVLVLNGRIHFVFMLVTCACVTANPSFRRGKLQILSPQLN